MQGSIFTHNNCLSDKSDKKINTLLDIHDINAFICDVEYIVRLILLLLVRQMA